jgi:hypothetical protein
MASAAPAVQAAKLTVGPPVLVARMEPHRGSLRGAGRGRRRAGVPRRRALCAGDAADQVVDGVVQHLARPRERSGSTSRRPRPARAGDGRLRHAQARDRDARVGAKVVAVAPVPSSETVTASRRSTSATGAPSSVGAPPEGRQVRRRAARQADGGGGQWALDSRVSIQLNYERTSQAPMMSFDHDDGILTRVRIGF